MKKRENTKVLGEWRSRVAICLMAFTLPRGTALERWKSWPAGGNIFVVLEGEHKGHRFIGSDSEVEEDKPND